MYTKNYYEEAANWWASKIEEENGEAVYNLDFFVDSLSKTIKVFVAKYAHMVISTYEQKNYLLEQIAEVSRMAASIPEGYEMKISYNTGAAVYDKTGRLLASFAS